MLFHIGVMSRLSSYENLLFERAEQDPRIYAHGIIGWYRIYIGHAFACVSSL